MATHTVEELVEVAVDDAETTSRSLPSSQRAEFWEMVAEQAEARARLEGRSR